MNCSRKAGEKNGYWKIEEEEGVRWGESLIVQKLDPKVRESQGEKQAKIDRTAGGQKERRSPVSRRGNWR